MTMVTILMARMSRYQKDIFINLQLNESRMKRAHKIDTLSQLTLYLMTPFE